MARAPKHNQEFSTTVDVSFVFGKYQNVSLAVLITRHAEASAKGEHWTCLELTGSSTAKFLRPEKQLRFTLFHNSLVT